MLEGRRERGEGREERLSLIFFLQINFFNDHTKVIICPLMSALSYIDEQKTFTTYKLSLIEKHGCSKEIFTRYVCACVLVC